MMDVILHGNMNITEDFSSDSEISDDEDIQNDAAGNMCCMP